jgi:hypothetical protein
MNEARCVSELRCEDCAWFRRRDLDDPRGDCLLYPPTVIWFEDSVWSEHPVVQNDNRCGQWRPREK